MSGRRIGRLARGVALALAMFLLLNGLVVAAAPLLELPRWVIGGGEAARASGVLRLTATAGQPAAGVSAAGPLTMYWGYWGPGSRYLHVPVVLKK